MNALPTNVSSRVLAQHVDASGTCVRSPNADAWFPENGRPAGARKLCKGCPVIAECLELALREEAGLGRSRVQGVRGSRTPTERYRINRQRADFAAARQSADCSDDVASYNEEIAA
ncbi:WhiB family transcriptional regulator [Streptosporangium lutulentum]|uniref:4Fe-4S Wbl-type domain-containing protein n=1 Tax=Streptosporangium lutulentum TaxID=1461250 RepID=A0ABT9QV09_9ACTN|nr:WhiB family transcriptional regulator [Streptosporangium lutulentum]MDP9850236.1 hypothetical protein [Streptosporangium lutulentum]